MDREKLLAAIESSVERCYGTDETSSLGQRRARAIQAYFGLNTNPAPEGRSQVVDRSVYETISTLMPSLVRIFASSSDEICKFLAVGPEDEQAADQTTALINHVVTQQNPWEQICSDWLMDAMLLCNGYCMAYWDESEQVIRETYEGQSDDQLAALVQDTDVRVIQHSSQVDEQATQEAMQAWQQQAHMAQQQAQMAMQQGMPPPPMPPQPQPVMLHDVVIERTENKGKVCIKVLPPEHCRVSVDTPSWLMDDCPYFEFRQERTIADLRAMGLDVPEDISDDEDAETDEDYARDRFGESQDLGDDAEGVMRRVWARMIWIRADVEGDGIARLYYVIAVGKTILFAEPTARIPVASMTPHPLPHRHVGLSEAETVTDIQDVRTAVIRGGLDNLYLANAGRYAISQSVSLEDFLDARAGGVVRMLDDSRPGEGHIAPLQHPVVFDQVIGSLEYFDQMRQNRTGASRYFSGTDANAINKTASGTIALQNMASMRVEHLARTMAPAVECLFSVVHEQISKHNNKALTLKLKGRWVTIDPQAWRTKRDVRISVGVGAGNKDSMMGQLQNVLAAQMQVGLPLGLVAREHIHATNTEILKLAGFSNPEKFWPDPQQLPPQQQQPSPEQIKAQADMQKEQFKAQQDAMKFQAQQQIEQEKLRLQAQVDAQREEMQARQKALESEQAAQLERLRAEYATQQESARLEFERWKASLDAAVKLEIANKSADTTMQTAQLSKQPDSRIDELLQTIQQLREEADSPAELVRGPDGRVAAVRRGSRERKVIRGPDGRAIGVQ